MELSIIVPSKDRKSILLHSLEKAYQAIEGVAAEIIVINDSKTEDVEIPSYWKDKISVFNNPKSGVASARNLGAAKASSGLLLFMDDDMWLFKENVQAVFSLHHQLGASSCLNLNWIYPPSLSKQMERSQFGRYLKHFGFDSLEGWRRGASWNGQEVFPVEGITSQNLSINKSDFNKAGGYNEGFPHAGFEDYDFSRRLLGVGIQPYIYPLSMMYHNEEDRMDVEAWLARKKRGGETRRVAVEMGYQDLKIHYGFVKSSLYKILVPLQPTLFSLLSMIPNVKSLDGVYFRLLNTMLGTTSFEGYHKKNKY
jgi:glycosyltransferase involved in cell wall biosynthesis